MKGKGIKPHVQPVRLGAPEPVKRFYAQSAAKGEADGQAGREPATPLAEPSAQTQPDKGTGE